MSSDDTPQPWHFEDTEKAAEHFTPRRRREARPREIVLDAQGRRVDPSAAGDDTHRPSGGV